VTAFINAAEVSKCYAVDSAEKRCCFYTAGSWMSFDEAMEYSEMKNSTLPIITDESIDKAFQQFISDSSELGLQNSSVWLGAYARPLNESHNWHWLNGKPSGIQMITK